MLSNQLAATYSQAIFELARDKNALEQVEKEMRQHFRPEFLNRLDDIIFFKPLMKTEISKIVKLENQSLELEIE